MSKIKRISAVKGFYSLDDLHTIKAIKDVLTNIINTAQIDPTFIHSSMTNDFFLAVHTVATLNAQNANLWEQLRNLWENSSESVRRSSSIGEHIREGKISKWDYQNIVGRWGSCYDFPEKLSCAIQKAVEQSNHEPVKLDFMGSPLWIFKGQYYETKGSYSSDEFRLLILDEFDQERRHFERLNQKFNSTNSQAATRSRIPESVRIEVWRRDGGKCAH
jgi:hypothetical protein